MDRYYRRRFVPLALPALILFVLVIVIPFIMGVIYSFTGWRGTYFAGGEHFWQAFVGFDNYIEAFKTKKFIDALIYTVKFTLVAVVVINVVSLSVLFWQPICIGEQLHTEQSIFFQTCWVVWLLDISGSLFLKLYFQKFCLERMG